MAGRKNMEHSGAYSMSRGEDMTHCVVHPVSSHPLSYYLFKLTLLLLLKSMIQVHGKSLAYIHLSRKIPKNLL